MKSNSLVFYRGPSTLDGQTIMGVVTGFLKPSANSKTGPMLQSWIMPQNVPPQEAVKTGMDASVCGNCRMRPMLHKGDAQPIANKPCYVGVGRAPRATWKANKDRPVSPPELVRALLADHVFRFGAWGDPSAIPKEAWRPFFGQKKTGYSHQWERYPEIADHCMASVHGETERQRAKGLGFRTFRVIDDVSQLVKGEILCPASKEAGERVQCIRCLLCDGSKGARDKRRDIAIVAH
jgi:hypothetical protein